VFKGRSWRRFLPTKCARSPALRLFKPASSTTTWRDTGPDAAKASIQGMLDKFLDDDSPLKPVETKVPKITEPGPVALYAPIKKLTQEL